MTLMAGLEVLPMEDSFEQFETPCEFGDDTRHEHEGASWVLFLNPCCGDGVRVRLACDLCKTERMTVKLSAVECDDCGHVSAPARKAYFRTESL